MKATKPGHIYELAEIGGYTQTLTFLCKSEYGKLKEDFPGVLNQEVLRVLIDRVKTLNGETPHPASDRIIHHLRMALVLHEARALERKVEKGALLPELTPVSDADGHFIF